MSLTESPPRGAAGDEIEMHLVSGRKNHTLERGVATAARRLARCLPSPQMNGKGV